MKCNLVDECFHEVKRALQDNLEAFKANITEHETNMTTFRENIEQGMKEMNQAMLKHLSDFEHKKNQLFGFDGARSFFFWMGQATNILTLIFLLYFLFFRGA